MKRNPRMMLVAAAVSLMIGALFLFLPWHAEAPMRRWVGVIWIVTGTFWLLAWQRQRVARSR